MALGILPRIALYLILQVIAGRLVGFVWYQSSSYTEDGKPDKRLDIPKSLPDVWKLTEVFEADYYQKDRRIYSMTLFAAAYIYVQAFTKSGTIYLTVLGIHIHGAKAWIICSFLEAFGCCCSFLLTRILFCPFITRLMNLDREAGEQYDAVTRTIQSGRWYWIVGRAVAGLRILPIMPNYYVNVASAMMGVPLWTYFIASLFASLIHKFTIIYVLFQTTNEPDSIRDLMSNDLNAKYCYFNLSLFALVVGDPFSMAIRYIDNVTGGEPDEDDENQIAAAAVDGNRREHQD